ncbi:uncharacterized protein PSFLO_00154 [Pseudozyma flocculosa]|uniref:Uncharacterized protein n=1 Tax=Pseudozyma flocculosa TaxID=84751 RepID=A0A5C3EQT8_9BASI|nr:uncharacterized protein PSFLO_00154 [Pseudozyma flocculosa]
MRHLICKFICSLVGGGRPLAESQASTAAAPSPAVSCLVASRLGVVSARVPGLQRGARPSLLPATPTLGSLACHAVWPACLAQAGPPPAAAAALHGDRQAARRRLTTSHPPPSSAHRAPEYQAAAFGLQLRAASPTGPTHLPPPLHTPGARLAKRSSSSAGGSPTYTRPLGTRHRTLAAALSAGEAATQAPSASPPRIDRNRNDAEPSAPPPPARRSRRPGASWTCAPSSRPRWAHTAQLETRRSTPGGVEGRKDKASKQASQGDLCTEVRARLRSIGRVPPASAPDVRAATGAVLRPPRH